MEKFKHEALVNDPFDNGRWWASCTCGQWELVGPSKKWLTKIANDHVKIMNSKIKKGVSPT